MNKYIFGAVLAISMNSAFAGSGAEFFTVGPKSAGDCDYTHIQEALDAERELLHIVEAVYFGTVTINSMNVSLLGGFSNCETAESSILNDDGLTIIEPLSGPAMIVNAFSEGDNYNVSLTNMALINGESEGIIPAGGLTISGDVDFSMFNSQISNNIGVLGGGVYVQSPASLFLRDTMVNDNTAFDGGGIYCSGCQLTVDRGSGIYNNQAIGKGLTYDGSGGGLYVSDDAQVLIFSGSKNPESEQLGIHQNEAFFEGGGIYTSNSELFIYGNEFFGFGDDTNPVSITHNSAYSGGGIFATASDVSATAFDVSNNQAILGGAGMTIELGSTLNVFADNLFATETCWNNNRLQCNRMMNNSVTGNIIGQGGGAIKGLLSEINVSNVWFQSNSAGGNEGRGAVIFHHSGVLNMQNSVMYQNGDESETDKNVIDVRESDFEFTHGSVVDNSVESNLMTVNDNSANVFAVSNSIFHNNDLTPVVNLEGDDDAFLSFNCMLVHEQISFAGLGSVINVVEGNPEFFNRSAGDLNLYSASNLAIDSCQAAGNPIQAFDLNLQLRGLDVNGMGNDDNPFIHDIGAIEYQGNDEFLDVIFKTSFEPIF